MTLNPKPGPGEWRQREWRERVARESGEREWRERVAARVLIILNPQPFVWCKVLYPEP